jgi:hypothetical protein
VANPSLNIGSEKRMMDSWSSCKERASFSMEGNLWMSACNLFDEMASSDFDEWRSPNRVLEVIIHRVCYPITESVLHRVFGSFGRVVEQILVIGGTDIVLASLAFNSLEVAADAYGLHGRYIYDGCCQTHIKWGLPTLVVRDANEGIPHSRSRPHPPPPPWSRPRPPSRLRPHPW